MERLLQLAKELGSRPLTPTCVLNIHAMTTKLAPISKANEQDLMLLLETVSIHGSNWPKISTRMDPEMASKVVAAMCKFGIDPTRNTDPGLEEVTLFRLPLCFPLEAVLLQKKLPPKMLADFPWQFRSPAIACLLLPYDTRAMKVANLATVNIPIAINNPTKESLLAVRKSVKNRAMYSSISWDGKEKFAREYLSEPELVAKMDQLAAKYDDACRFVGINNSPYVL